jgi:hypothetical protein
VRKILPIILRVQVCLQGIQRQHGTYSTISCPSAAELHQYIPVSTAACERGFSRMNLICTNLRTRLTVKHISSLMFISLSGPPISIWQPLPYVKSWLLNHRRSTTSSQGPNRKMQESKNLLMLRWFLCGKPCS